MSNITIEKTSKLKAKFEDANKLVFGEMYTDYMFTMRYLPEKGWHNAQVKPYEKISLDPASLVFHYGQEIFEGMKAYKSADGQPLLFRPEENFKRMSSSAERLKMPKLDEQLALDGLCELLKLEKDWIPTAEGTSLYIRPTMIAVDPYLGLKPSSEYLFFIIMCPVGAYYASGFNPVKIYVEENFVRAVKGGTGNIKAGGNYAASMLASYIAKEKGYSQILWLDAIEHKYVEEVGSMNIFFRFSDEVATPELSGSILPGITRKSIIQILKDDGHKVSERQISIQEVFDRFKKGELLEVFGTGTAAVVSPVGILNWRDETIEINNNETGELTLNLFKKLTGIQTGAVEDKYNWSYKV
ncbi:MAG: branched-chain amino acid aminotransferase [Eubacteriales bacterium]